MKPLIDIVIILPNEKVFSFSTDDLNYRLIRSLFQNQSVFNPDLDLSSYLESKIEDMRALYTLLNYFEGNLPSINNNYLNFNPASSPHPDMNSSFVCLLDFKAKTILSFKEDYINIDLMSFNYLKNLISDKLSPKLEEEISSTIYLLEKGVFSNPNINPEFMPFIITALKEKLNGNIVDIETLVGRNYNPSHYYSLNDKSWRIKSFHDYKDNTDIPFLHPITPMMYEIVEHLMSYGFKYEKEYFESIKSIAIAWSNHDELLDSARLDNFEQSFQSMQEKASLNSIILAKDNKLSSKILPSLNKI